MICAEFVIQDNKICSFSVTGHSGLAPAPGDILCASVSAMTMLVINTVTEVFGADLDLVIEEETPLISARLVSVPAKSASAVQGVFHGLKLQLEDLRETWPDYLRVR